MKSPWSYFGFRYAGKSGIWWEAISSTRRISQNFYCGIITDSQELFCQTLRTAFSISQLSFEDPMQFRSSIHRKHRLSEWRPTETSDVHGWQVGQHVAINMLTISLLGPGHLEVNHPSSDVTGTVDGLSTPVSTSLCEDIPLLPPLCSRLDLQISSSPLGGSSFLVLIYSLEYPWRHERQ
ncbi:hypothetical protein L208DRAFT_1412885 [Tricholoma matsutake]|nr:hypothetical protein L208DRAFT_1417887 [Tricholoma matsutake 945]KAF8222788.1 hypothetical protein L208DRAFT_1412885 [Tricholoma matsutake 945]